MNSSRNLKTLGLVGLAASLGTVPALGQATTQTQPPLGGVNAPPEANTGALTFGLGADVVTTYMFRGIEQEDSGLIVQPFVEVGAPLGDSGFDLTVGLWNSIHSEDTGADGNGTSVWYEADLYATLSYQLDKFLLGATYTGYYSPNGAFGDIEEIAFSAEYDDSDMFGDYAFAPYALVAFEVSDEGGSEDVYLELGGEFAAFFIESEDLPVTLSFPFAIGMSLDDYYTDAGGDNELFGYLLVGAAAEMPIDFIPSDYGVWTATAGLDVYFVNSDAGLLDDGDDTEIVLKVGVGLEY